MQFKVSVIQIRRLEVIVNADNANEAAEHWKDGELLRNDVVQDDIIQIQKAVA